MGRGSCRTGGKERRVRELERSLVRRLDRSKVRVHDVHASNAECRISPTTKSSDLATKTHSMNSPHPISVRGFFQPPPTPALQRRRPVSPAWPTGPVSPAFRPSARPGDPLRPPAAWRAVASHGRRGFRRVRKGCRGKGRVFGFGLLSGDRM